MHGRERFTILYAARIPAGLLSVQAENEINIRAMAMRKYI